MNTGAMARIRVAVTKEYPAFCALGRTRAAGRRLEQIR